MNLKNTIFILIIAIFILQMIVMKQDEKSQVNSTKPTVIVSTFALYDIVNHLAKDEVNLEMILPLGADTHSYAPTPATMAKLYDSDLVIYSGAGLEPWCKNIQVGKKVIDMSTFVNLQELEDDDNDSSHHHEGSLDPHYWLDVDNMISSVIAINNELVKLLVNSKNTLEKNKNLYINMLKKLNNDYKKQLSTCKLDTILVNHNAYSYLSKSYGFKIKSLSGLAPEAEVNAKSMIRMIDYIKEHKISTIFYESFASDKAMKNIANEIGISVNSLHPLGSLTKDEAQKQLSYEDIMRQNLEKISLVLECK